MEFGKIVAVPLREMWSGEATDFTPWLASHLDVISEKLGLELELESTEMAAGDFAADIVCRDVSTNRRAVIENQYGNTDHRHFGQILTYSAVLNASIVIWIAETIRQEHKAAIDFLNQNLAEGLQIYAIEASIIRIDDSKPAFVLNVVCMPAPSAAPTPPVIGETREKYRAYFQGLLDELRNVHKFTNARIAQPQNWYTFAAGNRIFKYSASFTQGDRVRVEVYLDCGDKMRNEAIFDALQSVRELIERDCGSPLDWEKLDARRACRIAIYRDGDIEADSEALLDIRKWMIDNLLTFRRVFPPYVERALAQVEATVTSDL